MTYPAMLHGQQQQQRHPPQQMHGPGVLPHTIAPFFVPGNSFNPAAILLNSAQKEIVSLRNMIHIKQKKEAELLAENMEMKRLIRQQKATIAMLQGRNNHPANPVDPAAAARLRGETKLRLQVCRRKRQKLAA
jgi:hypothetical protein